MAVYSQNQLGPGTPDCPVVHQTVSGAPGWLGANWPLSGIGGVTWLKITGLSGGAPDCPVSLQRPHPSTSATNSSLSGIHQGRRDYNSPDCPVSQSRSSQRSAAQSTGDAWPEPTVGWAHRTVRCANGTTVSMFGCAR